MNEEPAKVIEIYGDGKVKVEMKKNAACKTCAAKSNCFGLSKNTRHITAIDPIGVKVGNFVKLKLNAKNKIKASVFLFIIPLIFLVSGFFLGSSLATKVGKEASSETWGVLSGMVFFAFSFIILKLINHRYEQHEKHLPIIVSHQQNY
jgi:sigma-E factor negative regulatory protein RseC